VEELVKSKLEKPKKLLQLAAREWREIDNNTLVFDRPAAEVAELQKLMKDDLLDFFKVPQTHSQTHSQAHL
jgi:insulysin